MCSYTFSVFLLVVFPLMIIAIDALDDYRVVDTKSGTIRGRRNTSIFHKVDYYAFKGIHYAKNPTGELRFKAPEPIESWAPVILDAFEHADTCHRPLLPVIDIEAKQSEDCLALNVYVPAVASPDKKLQVLFYIHGGAYSYFASNDAYFGPEYLMDHQVILVTTNYRLGLLGFLALDKPEYSGNMGLKDQQLALKWIYENIDAFHGDNKKITIMGLSAGGASAHFHVLSEESRKYLNNAILISGTALTEWAMNDKNDHLSIAYEIAASFGHTNITFDGLIDFLKTVPADTLALASARLCTWFPVMDFKLAPVIEKKHHIRPFLTEDPLDVFKSSTINVDVLFITALREMLSTFYAFLSGAKEMVWALNGNFSIKLPFKDYSYPFESEEYRKLSEQVRKFYFGSGAIDENVIAEYIEMISDITFDFGNYKSIRMHLTETNGKSYMIRFSVNSALNTFKQPRNLQWGGASHADDVCYIFSCRETKMFQEFMANIDSKESQISVQTIKHMTKLITNFVKFGEPTYKDELISGFHAIQSVADILFLDVTNDGLRLDTNPKKDANEMWMRLEQQAKSMFHTNTN